MAIKATTTRTGATLYHVYAITNFGYTLLAVLHTLKGAQNYVNRHNATGVLKYVL